MSDTEEEVQVSKVKVRAPNRHKFKTLAERINEVDVDVYRRVGKVCSTPSHGATCFVQESLAEWRELNAARDWLDVERKLRPLAQSLPLLLHHKQQVLDVLLSSLRPQAALSLPPVFGLLVAAARDLQEELVPHMPAVWARFTWLLSPVQSGGGGCAIDPDILQQLFSAAAGLCKVLVRQLTTALAQTLKHTAGLRYHSEHHVRCLAAETFGYLFRQAPLNQLRSGLRAVMAEHALNPSPARAHGAGLLVGEAIVGVEHGLHSKAPVVLQLLFQDDLLNPKDFGATDSAAASAGAAADAAAAGGAIASDCRKKPRKHPTGLTREALRAHCTAVAAVALNKLLQHTRRGHTAVLWEALLAAAERRLAAVKTAAIAAAAAAVNAAAGDVRAAAQHAARSILLVAQAVHFFRGSRVEDYAPLIALTDQLVAELPSLLLQQQQQSQEQQQQGLQQQGQQQQQLQFLALQQQQEEHVFTAADFELVTLSQASLQLLLGLVLGHTKEVGASKGLWALKTPAARWATLLNQGLVPDSELLGFIQGLIEPPSTAAVAEMFAPQLLGSVGRMVIKDDSSVDNTAVTDCSTACSSSNRGSRQSQGLAALIRVCNLLRPGAAIGTDVPLLLTAQPDGIELAAALQSIAGSWTAAKNSTKQQLLDCWAGLQLLPHACVKPADAVDICSKVLAEATAACNTAANATSPSGTSSSTVSIADVLQLRGMALTMLAKLLPAVTPQQLPVIATDALVWVKQYSQLNSQTIDCATVSATAAVAKSLARWLHNPIEGLAGPAVVGQASAAHHVAAAITAGQQLLAADQLPHMVQVLLPCLLDSSQQLRAAALQLLCCYQQPAYLGTSSTSTAVASQQQQPPSNADRAVFEGLTCDELLILRDMHIKPCSIEAGRRWTVALERMSNHLEYRRIPQSLILGLVAGLIGVLHIRFSPIWKPASEALGEALTQYPDTAWPLIIQHITNTQQQFLGRNNNSVAVGATASTTLQNAAAATAAAPQGISSLTNSFDLQHQWDLHCSEGHMHSTPPAEAGGCTDAANRLTNLLQGVAAKASAGVLAKVSGNWVPLLLEFAAAVAHTADGTAAAAAAEEGQEAAGKDEQTAAAFTHEAGQQDEQTAGGQAAAVGAKRKRAEETPPPAAAGSDSKRQQAKRQQGGLALAVSREGLGTLGFSHKGWRGVMMQWLALLGAVNNPKKLSRSSELQEAVTRQLLSTDPSLQAAALRCLATFKLLFLTPQLLNVLLQLADAAKLRSGLVNIPMMFDRSIDQGVDQDVDQQQQQQQRSTLKGRNGSSSEVVKLSAQARPGFVPLLTMVLYPKLAKRSGRLGGRGAPGSARAAVLNALAALDSVELVPLLELLLTPISSIFSNAQGEQAAAATAVVGVGNSSNENNAAAAAVIENMEACRLIPAPWWSRYLVIASLDWWLASVDRLNLSQQPLRRRQGFLNAFEDMLQHVGYRLQPLLAPLLAITMHILELACAPLQKPDVSSSSAAREGAADAVSREEGRALRSQCLRILTQIFTRFPAVLDYNPLWPGFFSAVKPLMPRLMLEAVAAAPPALMSTVAALTATPGLARVLGNLQAQQNPSEELINTEGSGLTSAMQTDANTPQPDWVVEGLGRQLLSSCIAVLGAKGCSEASRNATLSIIENCLRLQEHGLLQAVLLPHTGQLLQDLKASVEMTLAAAGGGGRKPGVKGPAGNRPKRPSVFRQLALMEQLGQYCKDPAAAAALAAALVALLRPPGSTGGGGRVGAGCKRAALDDKGIARALGALAALWKGSAEQQQSLGVSTAQQQQLLQHWEVLSLLLGQLNSRDSRTASAAAMMALGALIDSNSSSEAAASQLPPAQQQQQPMQIDSGYAAVANIIAGLNSWSTETLDEPNYDRRLSSYQQLQQQQWCSYNRLQALPLLLHAFHDMRNDSDLALRQAAAAALTRAVVGMAELDRSLTVHQAIDPAVGQGSTAQNQVKPQKPDTLVQLVPRVLYPQSKAGLRSNSLAVRQEHAALLRDMVLQLPQRFRDLLSLTSSDPETDFFLNITHLQIHRRGRALQLLSRLVQQQQDYHHQQQGWEQHTATSPAKKRKVDSVVDAAQQLQAQQQELQGSDAAAIVGQKRPKQQHQEQQPQQQQHISVRVLMDIAAPLLQQFILEGGSKASQNAAAAAAAAAQRGGHVKRQGDVDREGAVADAAIDALRQLAGRLGWQQYSGLLQRWLKLMTQNPKKQVIRAACAILDAFHFLVDVAAPVQLDMQQQQGQHHQPTAGTQSPAAATGTAAPGDAAAATAAEQERPVDNQSNGEADVAAEVDTATAAPAVNAIAQSNVDALAIAAAARDVLLRHVLPVLQSQLVVDDKEVARAPVALALVKLIKLLPPEVERVSLPRALTSIANLLRSRLQSSRDAARAVLIDMSLELGPEYLPTIINVLRAVLPDKGFTAHVLGFTAAALLEAHVAAGITPGQLDEAMELLLPTLEGDLFGQVSEAKEATAFASKYKEAKCCRAYEAYQHLAAAITFQPSNIDQLIQLVKAKLPAATSPTVRSKLEQLLAAAARGLGQNPSVTAEGLTQWLREQLDMCLRVEEAARAKAKAAVGAATAVDRGSSSKKQRADTATAVNCNAAAAADTNDTTAAAESAGGDGPAHMYLLCHFCLTVMNGALKRGVLSSRDPGTLAQINPLLALLVRCLYGRHLGSVQAALKALALLIGVQSLPGVPTAAASAGRALSKLLQKVPDAGHPLAQDCFKLLGAMLRDCPTYTPPTPQLRFLLKWIAADLQSGGGAASAAAALAGSSGGGGSIGAIANERVSAYSLLRAVLGRRLLVPEVYDVIDIIQKQMITSHSSSGRAVSAAALLQFLLDYPLSPARLQQHIAFLLTNTAYEHEAGRLQALEVLQQVLLKFPPEVLTNLATTIYLPLIARLANETSPKARTVVAATVKLLHKQLRPQQNDQLAGYSQQWLVNGASNGSSSDGQQQQLLRAAAAYALGLLAESEGPRFSKHFTSDFIGHITQLISNAAAEAEKAVSHQGLAAADAQNPTDNGGAQGASPTGGVPRWQEVYHVLLIVEKASQQQSLAASQLAWQQGSAVQQFWGVLVWQVLLHPHLWVRKAAGRLLGLALATPSICNGLLVSTPLAAAAAAANDSSSSSVSAGQLSLIVYRQLEADVVDEGLCTQAVKCLVTLAKLLAAAAAVAGKQHQQQAQQQNGVHATADADADADADGEQGALVNGLHASRDGSSSSDGDAGENEQADAGSKYDIMLEDINEQGEQQRKQHMKGPPEITLLGLIVRMVKLAEDTRYSRQLQRQAALRWIAAAASAAGAEALRPHLPLLLRPLYRISEAMAAAAGGKFQQQQAVQGNAAAAASATSEDVRVLAEQVLAHLRTLFGSEQLLAAYTAAREAVKAARAARKTATARRALLDPEAAARLKLKRGKKKSKARQRKAEERSRHRAARGSGGFGYKTRLKGDKGQVRKERAGR